MKEIKGTPVDGVNDEGYEFCSGACRDDWYFTTEGRDLSAEE
jgi:hypothetical protein